VSKLLIRASKSPFSAFYNGPIPHSALMDVYRSLGLPGTKNIGNLVFAHSTYKALSAPDVELDIDDYHLTLREDFANHADRINDTYDAFVIPMDNSFRLGYEDSLSRATRTIKRLKIPVIVTGIGAQGDLAGNTDALRSMRSEVEGFVSAVLDRSESIGVRGEITRDYLVGLGYPDDRIDVIGCPSMFYRGAALEVKKRERLDSVALTLSNISHLTPSDQALMRSFTDYFNSHPEGVTYVPQVRQLMPAVYRKEMPHRNATPLDSYVPNLHDPEHIAFLCDVVPWMDFMKAQSFAIGTRIHGNVVPLLAGTPAHVIAHDSRTLELARYFEIPMTPLSKLQGFDLHKTYEESDYGNLNRNHGHRLAIYAKFLERNGLRHILYDNDRLASYDARVRESLQHAKLPEAQTPSLNQRIRARGHSVKRLTRQALVRIKSSSAISG